VYFPLMITGGCIGLMFLSRKPIYPWLTSLFTLAIPVLLLVTMVFGALQLRNDWRAYEEMSDYVSFLKSENARLTHEYRSSYDLLLAFGYMQE